MDRATTPFVPAARPVFVDPTGRRRTAMHLLALVASFLLVALLGSTVAAVAGDEGARGHTRQPNSILTPLPGGGE